VITRFQHAAQDVPKLRFVINQAQQRLAASTLLANTKEAFCRRVKVGNQQAVIKEDDAGTQAIENSLRIVARCSVVAGTISFAAA